MKARIYLADLKEKVKTPDGQGGFVITWTTTIGALWVEMNPLKAFEKIKYEKIDAKVDYKFILRSQITVKDGWQIVVEGRVFEIKTPPINLLERNNYQEVLAREIIL